MSGVAPERTTQNRVIRLLHEELAYRYLGDWKERAGNSNIEEEILTNYLKRRGYSTAEISGAVFQLKAAADISQVGLYEANRKVYSLLRYGVQVKAEPDQPTTTVALIDWHNPETNDFAIAEEVTLKGPKERRPDLVLYINGIAVGVIELKRSLVSIGDGIQSLQPTVRVQRLVLYQPVGLRWQRLRGLRYGAILTPENTSSPGKKTKQTTAGASSTVPNQDLPKERLISFA